jgi:hypothetical protein
MGLLKEKSKYVPTRAEKILAWIVTLAAGAALLWHIAASFRGSSS